MPLRIPNIIGLRFGRLLVTGATEIDRRGRKQWECLCDCGTVCLVIHTNLITGKTKSCGCINTERITKHGHSHSRIYRIWIGIRARCFNPNNESYYRYGGRGIKVCDRWLNFELFYKDVSPSYKPDLSLDRFPDNNGDYEPNNFRWANRSQQARNMRSNRFLTINGDKKTVVEWCEIYNVSKKCIYVRLKRGWSDFESVFGKNK